MGDSAVAGGVDGGFSAPRIQMMNELLASMGVDDHDPKASHMLLEFLHRYITEVVEDAKLMQAHANKQELDLDDVRLAIQSKVNGCLVQPPPREFMLEIARSKNAVPLPLIRPGVQLPPKSHCNAAANFQFAAGAGGERAAREVASGAGGASGVGAGAGAGAGAS
jgi:transcription initiation factor TFIID subunit 9B